MFVNDGLTNNLRFSSQLAVVTSANSKEKGRSPACRQNFFFLDSRICHPPSCSARQRRRRARASQRRLQQCAIGARYQRLGAATWPWKLNIRRDRPAWRVDSDDAGARGKLGMDL